MEKLPQAKRLLVRAQGLTQEEASQLGSIAQPAYVLGKSNFKMAVGNKDLSLWQACSLAHPCFHLSGPVPGANSKTKIQIHRSFYKAWAPGFPEPSLPFVCFCFNSKALSISY